MKITSWIEVENCKIYVTQYDTGKDTTVTSIKDITELKKQFSITNYTGILFNPYVDIANIENAYSIRIFVPFHGMRHFLISTTSPYNILYGEHFMIKLSTDSEFITFLESLF